MTIEINLVNLLCPNKVSYDLDANISDKTYEKISKELRIDSQFIFVYYNGKILSRDSQFENLQIKDQKLNLSYLNGEEFYESQAKFKKNPNAAILSSNSGSFQKSINFSQISCFSSKQNPKICGQEAISFQKDYYQQKGKWLEEIELKNNLISCSQSIMIEQEIQCTFCNNIFEESHIQTPCHHQFHPECLEVIIEAQQRVNSPEFLCHCNQKLSLRLLFQIFANYHQACQKQYIYLQNQVDGLRDQQKFSKKVCCCINKCSFYFIMNGNEQGKQHFCPLCCCFTKFEQLE